ncbi:UNVERIFIED_CONTAM: hypothetical protein GTU68_039096 [Idotea baltica]|nr:hypothetical protein [Idotea baltica]
MAKTLIIAEKPSVATDLARVLGKLPEFGKFTKKKDYFENDNAYISSAVGHLVELKMPLTPEGKKLPWSMKHLPVIPSFFELQPIERNESRYKLLVRSMTDGSIVDAWNSLRTGEEMRDLVDAAMCRSESDWLIGLNGTRALTAFNSRNGGFNVTTAGRVQTPTLVILAEKEKLIRAFIPEAYWEVTGDFSVNKGGYQGKWFREDFKKSETNNQLKAERIWSKEEAEAIQARAQGQQGVVSENKKRTRQSADRLFDLTSLQRASGYSAKRTLQLAQACYDRYKLLTYPRTDSRYLPEDYVDTVKKTIKGFAKGDDNFSPLLSKCSKWIMDNDKVQPSKRIFDTSKVSDHFAIIPTGKMPPAKIDDDARKIYELVLKRFLSIFYPPAEYDVTNRITRVGEDSFKTDGKILVVPGYLEVYGRKPGVAEGKDELVAADDGESAATSLVEIEEKETRPPARYTDATLLSAMETAGKRVEDEALREAMSERGLGTPATRANIIEGLIRQKYLFRNELNYRELVVSNKGLALVDLLKEIGLETLGSPEMTGEWEHKLKEMEHGRLDRTTFMDEIKKMTVEIVEQTREFNDELANRVYPDLTDAPCPECGTKEHTQRDGVFECKNPECAFRLKRYIASHALTEEEARLLMINRKIGPIEDFKSRFGQPFTAELILEKPKRAWKVGFVFEGDGEREDELKNLTDGQIICEAKILDDSDELVKVYETGRAYLAPGMATKKDERGVRISKMILKKEIPQDQAIKLFVDGKTDLIPGFISKKKNRPFAAHLTLDRVTGKMSFEFAARKAKKKKGAKKKAGADDEVAETTTKKKTTKKKAAKKKKAPKKKAAKKKTAKKKAPKKSSRTTSDADSKADTEAVADDS